MRIYLALVTLLAVLSITAASGQAPHVESIELPLPDLLWNRIDQLLSDEFGMAW